MDKQKRRPNDHLKRARELRGWSQEDLGRKIGTTQKIVSRWERNESTPVPYYRQRLCKLFEKNAAELGFVGERYCGDDSQEKTSKNATSNNGDVVQPH